MLGLFTIMELQQSKQTEKLIEEMLEFLDSTSEEEDDTQKIISEEEEQQQQSLPQQLVNENESSTDYQGAEDELEEEKALNIALDECRKERKSKNSLAKGIKKLKQQFPIWNTKEIVNPQKKSLGSQTNVTITEPIWRQCLLSKGADVNGESSDDAAELGENEWHNKLELNCRRSTNNAYVQEVQRAIYGDTTGHPASGSMDYYKAAQNYAVYGKDFLDFPENLLPLLNDKTNSGNENTSNISTNFGNGLYPTPISTPTTSCENNNVGLGLNNLGKPVNTACSTTCSSGNSATPAAVAAAAAASSAAYYQMCNSIQQPARATANAAAGNNAAAAAAYGMFLGNKVTYVATGPTAPPLVYNQHTSTTTNFISNSLANAALASSPAILYSNPMLTTTTQQYLNTFFKETQFLSTAGGASSAQGGAVGTTTGIYERLVYAQMLQQQIYHQTQQQAAAVAAMFQHKQRASAAAVAASVRATTNGSNNLINSNNSNNTAQVATIVASSNSSLPALNLCSRQATMTIGNSPDFLLIKQQTNATNAVAIVANGTEDATNALAD
ncbi:uncharacterized protein LOC119635351 [Glossina fuscipes]|uniref:Uncharacterized protein LOC119635351 n=1 Tax=Glossina fuscipes TaxID=7396 RepID=A0A8U0WLV8_9MUSC|nr:uncharacterized protein LOC119635351 [Glossina fuscipes]XP_037886069.1 uncharacterized protein LOC119635351 [Glossina fuscipes]